MKERPILFSAPMVRAILDGRKTVTRRLLGPRVGVYANDGAPGVACDLVRLDADGDPCDGAVHCPYGTPGDKLWLQEAHTLTLGRYEGNSAPVEVRYHADGVVRRVQVSAAASDDLHEQVTVQKSRGRPGRFLPRWASRLALEVVSTRVERLHEITEEDARAEGVSSVCQHAPDEDPRDVGYPSNVDFARDNFRTLWDAINGKRAPWSSNPWVWRVEFRRGPR